MKIKVSQIKMPHSITLANLPTKIEKLENISEDFDGLNIYIKRDDYTSIEMSGNKIRKLEFVLKDALEKNCDYLITCGGIQSNHARATAAAAVKFGLKSHLVLKGNKNENKNGNYFLDKLLGAETSFITAEEYKCNRKSIMEEVKKELEKKGHKPYIIPEGASNGLGNFGYIKAFEEILDQERSLNIKFDAIVVAVGSGSTYGGLLMGSCLTGVEKRIFGINIYDDKIDYNEKVYKLMLESSEYLDVKSILKKEQIEIVNNYVGLGYAASTNEELELIKYFASKEGLILDTVYTGKAFYGFIEEVKKGTFKENSNILFIHTGGLFGMFSKNELFNIK